jgi:flavodoxin I
MALTNCKMKVAIIYTSVTGNTKELAQELFRMFKHKSVDITNYRIEEFELSQLGQYDAVVIGTYTWGNGEIPKEMRELFLAFECLEKKDIRTAVFGTGDSFYANFCGAVDQFRDMLYVNSRLVATLKVELTPQITDLQRCLKLVDLIVERISQNTNLVTGTK